MTPEGQEQELSPDELQQRVLFSLLGPVVSLAVGAGISARDLTQWVQLAYLRHLREQGATLKEAGDVMGMSERSAKRLGQSLRTHFLRPEQEHNLPVRLEFILRAAPMSRARLQQVLRDVPATDLDDALDRLLAEGVVTEEPGRTPTLRVARSVHTLLRDTWLSRIGGLNSLLENLEDAVVGRFFLNNPRSVARTMTFHLLDDHYKTLERALDDLIGVIATLDQEAEGRPDARPMRLSALWAPFGLRQRPPRAP